VSSKAVTALLQLLGAEMDYWFDVCHVAKGGHIEQLQGMPPPKKKGEENFSICTPHVTILSTIQVYGFYKMCQRITNNPAQDFTYVSLQ